MSAPAGFQVADQGGAELAECGRGLARLQLLLAPLKHRVGLDEGRAVNAALANFSKALAGLGDQNAIPDLQRLSRRPLLFRQRRMAVALAARESIVAIEKRIDATLRDEPASEQETASETVAA